MFRRWLLWGSLLGFGCALALLAAACGGGDDDDEEEEAELDLAALVVAAFEDSSPRLPEPFTVDAIEFNARWSDQSVATLDFVISGRGGGEAYGVAVIFRDERTARATLQEEVEGWEAEESRKSRGHFCFWEEFGLYVNVDFEGVSYCIGRAGNVFLELELGEILEEDAEAGLDLLLALERHFDDLIEEATRRPRKVPPLPLAAMLASVPPPGPAGIEFATFSYLGDAPAGSPGLIGRSVWSGESTTEESMFLLTFDSEAHAEAHRRASLGSDTVPGTIDCRTPSDATFRLCSNQVGNTIIQTQRKVASSAATEDARLRDWTEALTEHVEDLSSGKIPRAPRDAPKPASSRTATAPAKSRTPAVTATPTPLPPIDYVNSGTWTLDLLVDRNTCPGGSPAVGSTIRLQYEFTDLSEDGYIEMGEPFGVEELVPTNRYIGVFNAGLPRATWTAETKNGALVGHYTIKLGFEAADSVLVDYTETYPSCEVHAY